MQLSHAGRDLAMFFTDLKKKKRFTYLFPHKNTLQCIYLSSAYAKARMCGFVADSAVSHMRINSCVT